jgi:hypothetical protein
MTVGSMIAAMSLRRPPPAGALEHVHGEHAGSITFPAAAGATYRIVVDTRVIYEPSASRMLVFDPGGNPAIVREGPRRLDAASPQDTASGRHERGPRTRQRGDHEELMVQ